MSDQEWHVIIDGEQQGPFPSAAIQDLCKSGRIDADTLIWCQGMSEWRPIKESVQFSSLLPVNQSNVNMVMTPIRLTACACAVFAGIMLVYFHLFPVHSAAKMVLFKNLAFWSLALFLLWIMKIDAYIDTIITAKAIPIYIFFLSFSGMIFVDELFKCGSIRGLILMFLLLIGAMISFFIFWKTYSIHIKKLRERQRHSQHEQTVTEDENAR